MWYTMHVYFTSKEQCLFCYRWRGALHTNVLFHQFNGTTKYTYIHTYIYIYIYMDAVHKITVESFLLTGCYELHLFHMDWILSSKETASSRVRQKYLAQFKRLHTVLHTVCVVCCNSGSSIEDWPHDGCLQF